MSKECPLVEYPFGTPFHEIPEYCFKNCEARWDEAVKSGVIVGDKYDTYTRFSFVEDSDCNHSGELGFSHEAIIAINNTTRQYVIVDECLDCGEEYGEAGYQFDCTQPPK